MTAMYPEIQQAFLESKCEQFMLESNTIEGENRVYKNDVAVCMEVFKRAKDGMKITGEDLLRWHKELWDGTSRLDKMYGGKYRTDEVGVYRGSVCVWSAPKAKTIPDLMSKFWKKWPKMDAFEAHVMFEKIHPFTDLNGRMGRLLWLYKMVKEEHYNFILTFQHSFYYQTLSHSPNVV